MRLSRVLAPALIATVLLVLPPLGPPGATAAPEGTLTWGVHITLAPTWLDPAETPGMITPFMILYALHDAMVKPMPGQPQAPSLAESWSVSRDGLAWEFVLRKNARFHDGSPVTSEDVKFSFDRYRGTASKAFKERVAAVETPDPGRVRFRLKQPWPDFLTFYSSATGAGWIVPKKYVERVTDAGFQKAPIGAGPYKFVSSTPGVEMVFEAFEQYWRKPPSIKRLVLRVIPDEATRLAALKRGEVDIVYSVRGELAEELQRTPGLALKPSVIQATFWLYFPEQWDSKSPFHDRRVRQAASLAMNRPAINQALTLGHSRITNSIIPSMFEFFWPAPPAAYSVSRAKALLVEAGFPNGLDAGDYSCDASYANLGEAVVNDLAAVGIRAKLRPLERAAFFAAYGDKKFKGLVQAASGGFGNTATRMEAFVVTGGTYTYGTYPDLDGLFQEQAAELDRKRREAILHKMQQIVHERTVYAPIWELAFLNGVGSRVGESGLGLINGHAYSAPYEDVTLKSK